MGQSWNRAGNLPLPVGGSSKTQPGQYPKQGPALVDAALCENLSKANAVFTLDLFKSLKDKDSNVFFSPLSVSSAFSMVLLGAKGSTAKQIKECLKTKDCRDVHSSFAALLQEFNKSNSSYVLGVANRLYGAQTYKFLQKFAEGTRKFYNAELETMDFQNKAEEARNQMNAWVEEQTQGKIQNLLLKGAVDSSSKVVLVNAIYLKANWNEQFEKDFTHDATFRLNKSETQTVKMMRHSSRFKLRQVTEVSCQVIELPYKGRELSMLIFLPNDIEDNTTGLERLEQQLTYETFMEWTRPDKMVVHHVELKLPRFRIEENYELSDVLRHMGMKDVFDMSKCDFSGMCPKTKGLVLSKAVHRAVVDVNEAGTEAAAATFVLMALGSSKGPHASFIADHPFLFFIRHNATRTILFAGRFCSDK